jgi:hypothetical protein
LRRIFQNTGSVREREAIGGGIDILVDSGKGIEMHRKI